MSSTNPPNPNVSTFNNLYWSITDIPLTQSQADRRYLKYPVAQGKETLQAVDVNGIANFNQPITMTSATAANRSISSSIYNVKNASNTSIGNITYTSNSINYQSSISNARHLFTNNTGGTDIDVMEITANNGVTITKSLLLGGATSLDRTISSSNYRLLSNTGVDSGNIYLNSTNQFRYENDVNSGSHNFLTKDNLGNTTTPITINSNGLIMNVSGDYIQFPDGTQQTTAAISTPLKTYTEYFPSIAGNLPSKTITIPANCYAIDLQAISGGGNAGSNVGSFVGGGGGGGQLLKTNSKICVTAGQQIIVNFATDGGGNFIRGENANNSVLIRSPNPNEAGNSAVTGTIPVNGVLTNFSNVIGTMKNGLNGSNATAGANGAGANAGSDLPSANAFATTWDAYRTTAGLIGGPLVLLSGAPRGAKWLLNGYGMGAVSTASVPSSVAGNAVVMITYYIGN